MFPQMKKNWMCVVAVSLAVGCSQPQTPAAPAQGKPAAVNAELLLRERPANAQPVASARTQAQDGAEIAILGRIGGAKNPWVEGRAAFTIVDPKLEPCKSDEGCPTPWDFCCLTPDLPANSALIKLVDGNGATLEQDARQLLGVKELQTVVVLGTAKRDSAGNLTVLARGVFVAPDVK